MHCSLKDAIAYVRVLVKAAREEYRAKGAPLDPENKQCA
jgi:hypothetical protein